MVLCLGISLWWRCVLGITFHGISLEWAMKSMFIQPTSMEKHSTFEATGQMWPASSQPLLLQQTWSPVTLGDGSWAVSSMITYKVRQTLECVPHGGLLFFSQCGLLMYFVVGDSALGSIPIKNVHSWMGDSLSCINWGGLVINIYAKLTRGGLYHVGHWWTLAQLKLKMRQCPKNSSPCKRPWHGTSEERRRLCLLSVHAYLASSI